MGGWEKTPSQGVRIGMVVNDMAEVNVDAKLVRDDPNSQGAGADSVELQNGCICWWVTPLSPLFHWSICGLVGFLIGRFLD